LRDTFGIPRNHIFNSHDVQFKDELMKITNGRGVDLILNSLAGELLHASWECVAPFGTMVELSRRDLADFGKLSLQPFLGNKSFSCVDMHHAIQNAPDRVATLLAKTMELYRDGQIGPIRPIRVYDAVDAQSALRRLQHADHVGKVVVSIPCELESLPRKLSAPPLMFEPEGAYLLVGGLGGLGRAIARWMAERGARHLVVLGRNAGNEPRHGEMIRGLKEIGCDVAIVEGSVEDPADVARAVGATSRPLKGVMHLAMVLRVGTKPHTFTTTDTWKDAPLVDMEYDDWKQVFGPKAGGALNLHNALQDYAELDFFVLASSLITVDPMPGQSNYCAANSWIEAFCDYRRARGLPASVLSIGAIEGAGFVSEHAQAEKNMRARGTMFLPPEALMDYLELAILCSKPITFADAERPWEETGHIIMGMKPDPARQKQDRRWAYYAEGIHQADFAEAYSEDRLQVLMQAARRDLDLLADRRNVEIVAEEIGRRIFAFLLKPGDNVHHSLAIANMGLDSLLSIELRRWWKQAFGQDISTVEIMGSGTLLGLAKIAIHGIQGTKKKRSENRDSLGLVEG
jgi:NAD(P)-dependent dehydrogenase (short-subunit alcohol dehydrogenase family)